MEVAQITALGLKQKLDNQDVLFLLDVREPFEFKFAQIAGSISIPLNQLPERLGELDKDSEIVVICHHGMRSLQAANFLVQYGFENITNLMGGIDAWSIQCDSAVPRY
ncbi:MAG: rhodanese-like domain-containing protein [Methylococcaceae bacterium]|jgi:rhodanese-related sulfurtransferase